MLYYVFFFRGVSYVELKLLVIFLVDKYYRGGKEVENVFILFRD